MFSSAIYNVTLLNSKKAYQIIVHSEEKLCDSPEQKSLSLVQQMGWACIKAYEKNKKRLGARCFYINTDFVQQLGKYQTDSFSACNYVYINPLGETMPGMNHYMIQLQQNSFFIGVDVAAKQYRKDKVIAEISIAKSFEGLINLLKKRHGSQPNDEWKYNDPIKNEKLLQYLGIGFFNKQRYMDKTKTLVNVKIEQQDKHVCVLL